MPIWLTNGLLRAAIQRAGHPEPEPGQLHLCGLRGARRLSPDEIELVQEQRDLYDDVIVAFGSAIEVFAASVDPGSYYTRHGHPDGCAHLMDGRYLYQRGLHKGKRALVQAGSVRIRRDADRDGRPEPHEPICVGWFGINIHAGGASLSVANWSAGCQVIHGGWHGAPWRRFMALVDDHPQRTFRYYLLPAGDLDQ